MNIKKNLKKIVATALLGASATCINTNAGIANLVDATATAGGLLAAINCIPQVLYNKSGLEMLLNRFGYANGLLNDKTTPLAK